MNGIPSDFFPAHSISSEEFFPISKVPTDVLYHIFSFLSFSDRLACSRVDKKWQKLFQSDKLWESKNSSLIERVTFLVERKLITWKEVHLYAPISDFLESCIQRQVHETDFIRKENPRLQPSSISDSYFVTYGNYSFSIFQKNRIKIHEKGKTEPIILDGQKKTSLIYLAVEGENLFALDEEGEINQWNYQKKTESKRIATAYTKKSYSFNNKDIKASLYVKNEQLILHYKFGYINFDFDTSALEFISYAHPEQSCLIENALVSYPLQTILEKNKLFIVGQHQVGVWNLTTREREFLGSFTMNLNRCIKSVSLDKNFLYAVDDAQQIYVMDLKAKKERRMTLPEKYSENLKITVIHNLLFGFDLESHLIIIFDLNKKALISKIPLKQSFHVESNLIEKIVKKAKENLHLFDPFKPDQSNKSKNCIIL